jgi:hypothetical protein
VPARKLVQRPGRDGGLLQFRELRRGVAVAALLQLASEPRAFGDERIEIGTVELVSRFVERHSAEATAFAS